MRFFVLTIVLFVYTKADDQQAAETHLNELVPTKIFSQLDDGWKKSLAFLQVKDVLALPKIYAQRSKFTSAEEIKNAISSESPNLQKVLEGTLASLKEKHDKKVGRLHDETKKFGIQVLTDARKLVADTLNSYQKQSKVVRRQISKNYPNVNKLINLAIKNKLNQVPQDDSATQAATNKLRRRPKRSASDDPIDQVAQVATYLIAMLS